ncbi:unnamed protein product, partial [Phaeothamnion confervicola]
MSLQGVVLSKAAAHTAPELTLSRDQLTVAGDKGFRMSRATLGVDDGNWYWELVCLEPEKPDSHCRAGWSTDRGELQAPVGYDRRSYAYRDIAGSKVHDSQRYDNYGEPWGPGDV